MVKTFCSGPPIDDNELDALLEMRERDGHSESFRIALCGRWTRFSIRLYSAERQLVETPVKTLVASCRGYQSARFRLNNLKEEHGI